MDRRRTVTILWFMNPFARQETRESLSEKLGAAMIEAKRAIKRILIVDDDDTLCELITRKATKEFYAEVVNVGTITHARQLFDYGDRFDGLILDARLTNGNGVALYREILEKKLPIPVVFLTGYDSPQFRAEVEAVGPATVCSKNALFRDDFFDLLLQQIGIVKKPENQ